MKTVCNGMMILLQPDIKTSAVSIYHKDDGKCEFYNIKVKVEFTGNGCYIEFTYLNDPYELRLLHQGNGHYKGSLFVHREFDDPRGSASLELYRSEKKVLLVGDYEEESNGFYNCFIEILC